MTNNCYECDNAVYCCEGDFFCDKVEALVIDDFEPTESFGGCENEKK